MIPPDLTRFALPGGEAQAIHAELLALLGAERLQLAACLGLPDPFHLLPWLEQAGDIRLPARPGLPLTVDAAEAALVEAGPLAGLSSLFAGCVPPRLPGPMVRAVPVSDARYSFLCWPRPSAPALPRIGRVERWTAAEFGEEPVATIRCLEPIPGGLAIGSDYGLTIWRDGPGGGRFTPFPWPAGCRREARRVEAMAFEPGVGGAPGALWIGTMQNLLRWEVRSGEISFGRHGADQEGGWDDLLSLLAQPGAEGRPGRLLIGYRTRLAGGRGPADVLSIAADPAGVVFAGTRGGEIHVIDGGGSIRSFVTRRQDGSFKGYPVRHLAFAAGQLHVAAGGAWHRFDGCRWSTTAPEPTAFYTDHRGRLWAIVEGRVCCLDGGRLAPLLLPVLRPWSICVTGDADGGGQDVLWVGAKEALYRVGVGGEGERGTTMR